MTSCNALKSPKAFWSREKLLCAMIVIVLTARSCTDHAIVKRMYILLAVLLCTECESNECVTMSFFVVLFVNKLCEFKVLRLYLL